MLFKSRSTEGYRKRVRNKMFDDFFEVTKGNVVGLNKLGYGGYHFNFVVRYRFACASYF